MPDIGGDLVRPQAAKGVVHGDTLAESFVDRFFEGIVQVRLPAQDECEAVKGVVVEIHQHLEVFEYSIAQVLGFINGQDKGLFLFLIVLSIYFSELLDSCKIESGFNHVKRLLGKPQ